MPPKKKGKKDEEGDEGDNSGKENKSNNSKTKIKFKKTDWEMLVGRLRANQTNQDTIRAQIEGLMPRYISLSEGERNEFLKDDGRPLKKETRKRAAERFTDAQSRLEDFLFYQNPVNRWKRYGAKKPTPGQRAEARKVNKQPMLIDHAGENPRNEQYLRDMLGYYDQKKIGTSQTRYRQGNLKDGTGEASTGPQEILLEPEDLHLFTPAWRRVPAGLRQLPALQDMERATQAPIRIRVNEEAMEKIRKKWDDKRNETEGVGYDTHTERRAAELKEYENTRLSTANALVKPDENGGQTDENRFREIQTASGVFISALESSHDWLTSYDCLGLVKNCSIPEYFETSAVREEDRFDGPPDEDEDLNAKFNPPGDVVDGENGKEGETGDEPGDELEDILEDAPEDNSGGAAKDSSNEAAKDDESVDQCIGDSEATLTAAMTQEMPEETDRKLRSGRTLRSSPMSKAKKKPRETKAAKAKKPVPTVSKGVGDDPAPAKGKKKKGADDPDANKGTKKTTEDEDWKKARASRDYPYNKQEFCLPKKTRKVNEGRLVITGWAEATDGRRERHVGMVYKPSSPVNSPPRSPIDPDTVDISTIPEACREDDHPMTGREEVPSVAAQRRRCKHGNVTCRAWWTHATDERWTVHKEPTSLPTNRMEIDEPVVLKIPQDRRKKYHERLFDHYGRTGQGKATWPRLGIRVAYEPTTFAAIRRHGTNVTLHGWRSLAMPVIEEALEAWNP